LPWPLFHPNNFAFYLLFIYNLLASVSHRVRIFQIRHLRITLLYETAILSNNYDRPKTTGECWIF
jgi:hypothetical protein